MILSCARIGKATANRPGLRGAIEDLDDGEAEGLVVCKLDRLSRTTMVLGMVERANRDGWQLHSTRSTSTPRAATAVSSWAS